MPAMPSFEFIVTLRAIIWQNCCFMRH